MNIVHRDVKSDNILFESNDNNEEINIVLADFGFATKFQPEEKLDLTLGTLLYMAPEIVKHEPYDSKVDIWGVGVILHILLKGAPPFVGSNSTEVMEQIVNKDLEFSTGRAVSPEADQFILQCLLKDPSQRPSAEELFNHPWLLMSASNEDLSLSSQDDLSQNL